MSKRVRMTAPKLAILNDLADRTQRLGQSLPLTAGALNTLRSLDADSLIGLNSTATHALLTEAGYAAADRQAEYDALSIRAAMPASEAVLNDPDPVAEQHTEPESLADAVADLDAQGLTAAGRKRCKPAFDLGPSPETRTLTGVISGVERDGDRVSVEVTEDGGEVVTVSAPSGVDGIISRSFNDDGTVTFEVDPESRIGKALAVDVSGYSIPGSMAFAGLANSGQIEVEQVPESGGEIDRVISDAPFSGGLKGAARRLLTLMPNRKSRRERGLTGGLGAYRAFRMITERAESTPVETGTCRCCRSKVGVLMDGTTVRHTRRGRGGKRLSCNGSGKHVLGSALITTPG